MSEPNWKAMGDPLNDRLPPKPRSEVSFRHAHRTAQTRRELPAEAESLLARRRRKDLARIHRPAMDDEGTCTWCGVPDMHCQCPDVDTNEGSWRADDVADSYEDEA